MIIFFLLSCKSDNYINNNDKERQEILTLLHNQQNSWNIGDIEGYMQGYLHSDSLRFASGGNVRYGWEKTLAAYKKGYPTKEKMGQLYFSDLRIDILSEKYALAFGKWNLERMSDNPNGLFTLFFVKTKEGWRIFADHTSSAKDN